MEKLSSGEEKNKKKGVDDWGIERWLSDRSLPRNREATDTKPGRRPNARLCCRCAQLKMVLGIKLCPIGANLWRAILERSE